MNIVLLTPKALQSSWDDVIAKGDKRQRRILRFFAPFFIARGLTPQQASDAVLQDIVAALPEQEARDYLKQSDAKNRTAANSFVRALQDISARESLNLPELREFPSQNADALQAKEQFKADFKAELDALFSAYRLPDTFIEKRDDGSLAPRTDAIEKLGAVISDKNRDGIINGLYSAYQTIRNEHALPPTLSDLHRQPLRAKIIVAAKAAKRHGRAIEMLRALAQLAAKDGDLGTWRDLNNEATQIHTKRGGNTINRDLLRRLEPFHDIAMFHALGQRLVSEARIVSSEQLKTLRRLVRVTAALAAILAILAPATFEIINAMTFSGPDYDGRPELWSEEWGSLEKPLHSQVRALVTAFYHAFHAAYGVYPQSILVGTDGLKRQGGATSVNTLLENMKVALPNGQFAAVDLTASELRDLGVFRMAWGDDADETMATAARVSEKYLREHYTLMLNHVKATKRKSPWTAKNKMP